MKQAKTAPLSPSVLAIKKSLGTLSKVVGLLDDGKNYGAVIQQIDAAIGLAQSAKKTIMAQYLEKVVKENKNQKKLVTDLQKLYTYTTK